MAKVLIIIAPKGYQDHEYGDTKMVLEANGHQVITASESLEVVAKFESSTKVDLLVKDVKENDYDAIVLIGGPGVYDFFDNKVWHELALSFFKKEKVTCAICAAPSVLANAGILKGKKATCFTSEIENIKSKGAIYLSEPVVVDGNLITADGPDSAIKFGENIAEYLEEENLELRA